MWPQPRRSRKTFGTWPAGPTGGASPDEARDRHRFPIVAQLDRNSGGGVAGAAERVAAADLIADLDGERPEIGDGGEPAMAVVDHHDSAIGTEGAGISDAAGSGGDD